MTEDTKDPKMIVKLMDIFEQSKTPEEAARKFCVEFGGGYKYIPVWPKWRRNMDILRHLAEKVPPKILAVRYGISSSQIYKIKQK